MNRTLHTHKITIDLPNRTSEVSRLDEPNLFDHFSGSEKNMIELAEILNQAMGRMEARDIEIPFTADEQLKINAILEANNG